LGVDAWALIPFASEFHTLRIFDAPKDKFIITSFFVKYAWYNPSTYDGLYLKANFEFP